MSRPQRGRRARPARPPRRPPPQRPGGRPPSSRYTEEQRRKKQEGSFRMRAAPKAFEIRKGSAGDSDESSLSDSDAEIPISHVVLPQSITQEAEEDSLRKRFNREDVPVLSQRDDRVQLRESGGAHGPDRYVRRRILTLLLLLLLGLAAGGAWFYQHPDKLPPQVRELIGR